VTMFRMFAIALVTCAVTACFTAPGQGRGGQSSSLVEYLYPDGERPPPQSAEIPTLRVPLRVGVAFVPGDRGRGIPEATQMELLGKVKAAFEKESFIKEIVIIPDNYLRGGRGFDTLAQVSRLFDVEVMALVSYDQVTSLADNKASVFYWTIVGAYVIPGSDNSVQTFVDTAVFDMPTRKLLFRAPGISRVASSSTLVNASAELEKNEASGFQSAVDDMNRNLAAELTRFQERIKTENVARVANSNGEEGGGSAGWAFLLPGLVLLWRRRRDPDHHSPTLRSPRCRR
jgi:rhombotail lipoprotein